MSTHAKLVHTNHARPDSYQHGSSTHRVHHTWQHSEPDLAKPGTRNKLDAKAPPSSNTSTGGSSLTRQDIRKRPKKTSSPEPSGLEWNARDRTFKFACTWDGCTRSFTRRHDLNRHSESCHLQNKKGCSWCGKLFSR